MTKNTGISIRKPAVTATIITSWSQTMLYTLWLAIMTSAGNVLWDSQTCIKLHPHTPDAPSWQIKHHRSLCRYSVSGYISLSD